MLQYRFRPILSIVPQERQRLGSFSAFTGTGNIFMDSFIIKISAGHAAFRR